MTESVDVTDLKSVDSLNRESSSLSTPKKFLIYKKHKHGGTTV